MLAWFKVDDGFWSHPKILALSADAVALWVRAGAYSCQHLTDGEVQESVLRLLGSEDAAAELHDAGLWLSMDGGYRFHDWDEYQETSETVKKRRSDARDRQRRAREVAAEKRRMSRSESRVTDGVTDSVSNGVSSLYPTRPDPTRPDPLNKSKDSLREGAPPAPKCRKHVGWEHDESCRTCGADRIAFEAWEKAEAAKPKPAKPHEHKWMDDGTCLGCTEQKVGDF